MIYYSETGPDSGLQFWRGEGEPPSDGNLCVDKRGWGTVAVRH